MIRYGPPPKKPLHLSLSGPFQIDRNVPPDVFYTVQQREPGFGFMLKPGIDVFAESGLHPQPHCITLGDVSQQSPFGQGMFRGMPRSKLRQASNQEILQALVRDHPLGGRDFRPDCPELNSPHGRAEAAQLYNQLMADWKAITRRQCELVVRRFA